MENELNKLIEAERNNELQGFDDLEINSTLDLEEFERKVKSRKKILGNQSDSDSDYDSKKKSKSKTPAAKEVLAAKNKGKIGFTGSSAYMNDYKVDNVDTVISSKNDGLKDKKIKELAGKNKSLLVAYEKEKQQVLKLESELQKVNQDNNAAIAKMELTQKKSPPLSNPLSDTQSTKSLKTMTITDELAGGDLMKKYKEAEKKIQELRVDKSNLKNELNKALRVISREVGEDANVDQILLDDKAWKGRAQQIQLLRNKIKELEAKLSLSSSMKQAEGSGYDNMEGSGYFNLKMNTAPGFNHPKSLLSKNEEKRKEVDTMKFHMEALKKENELLHNKIKALSSRKSVLESEYGDVKGDFEKKKKVLIDKSSNDDKYIAALKLEIEKLKNNQPPVQTKIIYKNYENEKSVESKVSNEEIERYKKELKHMHSELSKREKMITELIQKQAQLNAVRAIDSLQNHADTRENSGPNKELSEKLSRLEAENRRLKEENIKLSTSTISKQDIDNALTMKELSNQNAGLRRKIDDLQQKLAAIHK